MLKASLVLRVITPTKDENYLSSCVVRFTNKNHRIGLNSYQKKKRGNSVMNVSTVLPMNDASRSSVERVYQVVVKQAALVGEQQQQKKRCVDLGKDDAITNPSLLNEAYDRCGEVCAEYAKTFYLGTLLMTPERQRAVWAIYVWCRRTDELVDGPNASHITPMALDRWEQRLVDLFEGRPYDLYDSALSDTVSKYPVDIQAVLRGLCEDLGIPFQQSMLKWEAGPKPVDGLWAPWWYKNVHKSTCFISAREYPLPLPHSVYDLLEQSLPFYNMLRRHTRRISSITGPPLPIPTLPVPANEKILVWVGDEIVPRESAKVSVFDSVVQGGDAVWEGLRVYNGKVFKLDEHLDRLSDSAKALALTNVPTRKEIKGAIFKTLISNAMFDNAHIRLTLTRGKKVTSGMSPAFNLYGCTLIGNHHL